MWLRLWILLPLLLVLAPLYMVWSGSVTLNRDWRTANRSSAGIAPDPATTPGAVVQVYGARALRWRGIFGVHTWIAAKPENAPQYTVHQLIGWRVLRNLPGVRSEPGIPDGYWFGNSPELLADLRGPEAQKAIGKIEDAIKSYPYMNEYRLWPGPNSNTFTAHVARHVPELKLQLPVTAIGKDYLVNGAIVEKTPSGTGVQISAAGLLGILIAKKEGVEFNLLGLSFGVDLLRPALKLPFIGRIGFEPDPKGDTA